MLELNAPLLRKTLEHIEADQEHWNQEQWIDPGVHETLGAYDHYDAYSCDTSFCFAGWAAFLDGAKFIRSSLDINHLVDVVDEKGREEHVSYYAKRALGLRDGVAYELFHSDNNLDDLRRIVNYLLTD